MVANEIGNYAGNRAAELRRQGDEAEAAKWDEGGAYRVAAHTALGALGGGVAGAVGAGSSAAITPDVAKIINDLDLPEPVRQALIETAGTAIGGVIGGTTGAMAGANQVVNNYLKHDQADQMLSELQACQATKCSREAYLRIIDHYEAASAANSAAMMACPDRTCVEKYLSELDRYDKKLLNGLTEIERKLGYDMYGLTHGNPDVTASKPFNPADSWGDKYVLDRDLAMGKIIANGWLTPDENAQLAQWNPRTGWLDTAAGRKLSVEEKEQLIAMLQSDAGPGVAQLAKMGS